MFDRLRALVGGQRPTGTSTDMLPPEVQTVIASARVMEREGADENSPRILVQTARGSFWGHDAEQVRAWLAASWSELTEAQRGRAAAMLAARVGEAQRENTAASAAAMRGRSSWRDWKPLERL
ncbi:hypothetical protein [Cupriavidus campinensis]|uniref:Uncharacterized protein n=1 Tax=Cupriavidus campinensis TaxID=151783 RepID=A0AAE9I742_9BURK|nr:hypothetical protein [Cupriavidus campinensis]URF05271.1 hypothetical protein M5D45_05470 [Cupriavidus campinensis]